MIVTQNMNHLKKYSQEAYDHMTYSMREAEDFHTESFMRYLGGNVCIIEDMSDLNGLDITEDDVKEWTAEATYRVVFQVNNNTGGPTFFIPSELWHEWNTDHEDYPDVDETNYDPYAGCDVFERNDLDDIPF